MTALERLKAHLSNRRDAEMRSTVAAIKEEIQGIRQDLANLRSVSLDVIQSHCAGERPPSTAPDSGVELLQRDLKMTQEAARTLFGWAPLLIGLTLGIGVIALLALALAAIPYL